MLIVLLFNFANIVYALWKVPKLLYAFMLKGDEVPQYVIGGVDLMFSGMYVPPEGLPSFVAGEPWEVKALGYPSPSGNV